MKDGQIFATKNEVGESLLVNLIRIGKFKKTRVTLTMFVGEFSKVSTTVLQKIVTDFLV